eukprot:scaffold1821_cov344-Pavlova_lutheri.AAC.33
MEWNEMEWMHGRTKWTRVVAPPFPSTFARTWEAAGCSVHRFAVECVARTCELVPPCHTRGRATVIARPLSRHLHEWTRVFEPSHRCSSNGESLLQKPPWMGTSNARNSKEGTLHCARSARDPRFVSSSFLSIPPPARQEFYLSSPVLGPHTQATTCPCGRTSSASPLRHGPSRREETPWRRGGGGRPLPSTSRSTVVDGVAAGTGREGKGRREGTLADEESSATNRRRWRLRCARCR